MKILHLSKSDIVGGAARAMYRLHQCLRNEGLDSVVLCQDKQSGDYSVIGPQKIIQKSIASLRPSLDTLPVKKNRKNKTLFSPAWLPFGGVVKNIEKIRPDIVHLHWIYGGMIRIERLTKIKAPIIWTLQDQWAYTGGCHYDEDCGKYKNQCERCPVLESGKKNDLSRKIFRRKSRIFSKINNMTIIGSSRWMSECARESRLLKGKKIITLPNPIDTNKYKPIDKNTAKSILNLSNHKKFILFGAVNATGDPRKGFKELIQALRQLKRKNIEFIVFGSYKPLNEPGLGLKIKFMGQLSDDISLQVLYSAVDVMIVPSLQESFGQTASESLSCGTPVVCFAATGLLDIVDHKKNGYLAKPFDTKDLADGIEWVLNNPDYNDLCANARKKVLKEFDSKVVAKKYIKLYKEILNKK